MAAEQQKAQATTATTAEGASLLEQVLATTKQTERSRAEDLLRALTDEALKGTVTWSRNVTQTITQAIATSDKAMSTQLASVMHHPDFQKLEGSWRGLHHLVMNSETGAQLKIRVLNIPKRELFKDV